MLPRALNMNNIDKKSELLFMRVCLKIINIRKKEKRERSVNTRASLSLSKSDKIFLLSVGENK
jgi:hypothetical protein